MKEENELTEEEIKSEMETLRDLHYGCLEDSLTGEVVSSDCLYRNVTGNSLEDNGVKIEFCLTCGFPVAPNYEVDDNRCPRCKLAFDLPEKLKSKPDVPDKQTLQEETNYSWIVMDKYVEKLKQPILIKLSVSPLETSIDDAWKILLPKHPLAKVRNPTFMENLLKAMERRNLLEMKSESDKTKIEITERGRDEID